MREEFEFLGDDLVVGYTSSIHTLLCLDLSVLGLGIHTDAWQIYWMVEMGRKLIRYTTILGWLILSQCFGGISLETTVSENSWMIVRTCQDPE